MLEKPEIEDQEVIDCLREAYGVKVDAISFLPLGADVNTAVYRADSKGTSYFVKLRRGDFKEASVVIPNLLAESGARHVIACIKTSTGRLWADFAPYTVILYPFVEGHHGYIEKMTET